MTNFIIDAEISVDKRLTNYELPADVPVGPVRLVIEPMRQSESGPVEMTREEAREKLRAAGLLSEIFDLPLGAIRSDEAEDRRLADLFTDPSISSMDLINWTRGPK